MSLRCEPGIDFQTAHAAGLPGLDDHEVLALAAKSGRLLTTHDRKTMPAHFAKFIVTEVSAGVLVIPLLPVTRAPPEPAGYGGWDGGLSAAGSSGLRLNDGMTMT